MSKNKKSNWIVGGVFAVIATGLGLMGYYCPWLQSFVEKPTEKPCSVCVDCDCSICPMCVNGCKDCACRCSLKDNPALPVRPK